MDVFEALSVRKSTRKYKNAPVEDEKIQKILESARYLPQLRTDRNGSF